MNPSEPSDFAAEAEKALELLLEEAVGLLKDFDMLSPDAIEETSRRREEILARFHDFDGRIASQRKCSELEGQDDFEVYRLSRDVVLRKILETDSLVIALAKEQLSVIKDDLAALTKGKKALHAYEGSSVTSSRSLNDTV